MITLEQATAAQEALINEFGHFQLVGPAIPPDELHYPQSIGISADGPDFSDHFIMIEAPPSFDVSHIPPVYNGVRIVIDQESPPGWYVAL
jgi:hypothetical protein